MHTVEVKRTIKAPIEKVFEVLVDHANYKSFPGIVDSKLIREGRQEKNGVGALREIDAGRAWFQEEITEFIRPTQMDYRIVKSRPPIRHQGGSIILKLGPEGTSVTWTSTFELAIPLVGGLLTHFLAPQLERAFRGMLKSVEQRLAA